MKKIYFIGPIAALALFAAYTWHFNQDYNQKEEAKATEARIAREAKIKTETEARKKAIADALASQEKIKAARLAKEAEEVAKKEARVAATDARDRNFREQEKLVRTVERLKKEMHNEEEAVAKLEASIKYAQGEKAFETEFITKAQQNLAGLSEILTKIDAAEAARVSAAAAEAAAAKAKS